MTAKNIIHPTNSQRDALAKLWAFLDDEESKIFILKGYAGTGKTTMMKLFIQALSEENREVTLLASTGRAAKILSDISGFKAKTIHSHIYNFSGFNKDIDKLADGTAEDTEPLYLQFGLKLFEPGNESDIYIVDEASMVSDKPEYGSAQAKFGSGNLIKDLLSYNEDAKFIFVGDECQLPPVNDTISPALNSSYLMQKYHVKAEEFSLTEIVRQSRGNDIVLASSRLRQMFHNPPRCKWVKFPLKNYSNIRIVQSQVEMLNKYVQFIRNGDYTTAALITYSNKACTQLSMIIRPALGFSSYRLQEGELLLITQNNMISGLMNGDLVVVSQVGGREEKAGMSFVHVTVKSLADGEEHSQLLIEDILYSQSQVNISQEQQRELYIDYAKRMKERGVKSSDAAFKDGMRHDSYLNALRAVYGYALTCHKSQGGEWKNVFIDIPKFYAREPKPAIYQWLYTSLTRASEYVYIVDNFYVG